jgi:hypothetical protein
MGNNIAAVDMLLLKFNVMCKLHTLKCDAVTGTETKLAGIEDKR